MSDDTRTDVIRRDGETVRTADSRYAPIASKRFELRLTEGELAAWKELAGGHRVSMADVVRAAMTFAAEHMPADYIEQRRRAFVDALPSTSSSPRSAT